MKKGVIFTTDAIIALSIFLVALGAFYSLFIETSVFEFSGTNIYSSSNNLVITHDKAQSYSSAYEEYQQGDNTTAEMIINLTLEDFNYPANVKLYRFNGTELKKVVEYGGNSFERNVVVRRYLVYVLTKSLSTNSGNLTVISPSTVLNKNITVNASMYNSLPVQASVNVSLKVLNSTGSEMSWNITPSSRELNNMPSGSTEDTSFVVEVPETAIIDTYYSKATATGDLTENATNTFQVMDLGMVELEAEI